MQDISIGISPCPNDTYIFYALLEGKIKSNFNFKVEMHDVEVLNKMAMRQALDISKISFGAYGKLIDNYILLNSGSALGEGVGPLLISKHAVPRDQLHHKTCLIPGENTTANLLLSILYPEINTKEEVLFSEIENRLINNEDEIGLIIHESRFTYQRKGLSKIDDLGDRWQQQTNHPIPLGGIVAHRNLDQRIARELDSLIKQSILYANNHEDEALGYCKYYAQEMEIDVMQAHIELYVNAYSEDLGKNGRETIEFLLGEMQNSGQLSRISKNLFI